MKTQSKEHACPMGYRFFISISASIVSIIILVLICLPLIGEMPQKYTDLIYETTAMLGKNKSGELTLFWIALIIGCAVTLLCDGLLRHRKKAMLKEGGFLSCVETIKELSIIVIPNVVLFVITGQFNVMLLMGALLLAIVRVCLPQYWMRILFLAVFVYYALLGMLSSAVSFGMERKITTTEIQICAVIVTAAILLVCYRNQDKGFLNKAILMVQLLIPLGLLHALTDITLYQGEPISVPNGCGYNIIIVALVGALIMFSIYKCAHYFKHANSVSTINLIFLSSIIVIFVLNSYFLPIRLVWPDWHHHGEQSIPWQQIIGLGQSAYQDYSPVSGLFPMLIGFFQNVILDGTVTAYGQAIFLVGLLFSIVTIVLCYYNVGGSFTMVIALLYSIPSYNRQLMVLPTLLLLMLPALIKNRNRWLKVWFISCLLGGLYYPLYGGAVLLGTLPFAIIQCIGLSKSGELKTLTKKTSFYLYWSMCLLPAVACSPLLFRMARHVLVYSSQTVLADGIPIYGQSPPDNFFGYLSNPTLRLILYYGLRFALPILGVVLFVYCLYLFLCKQGIPLWEKLQSPFFLGLSAGSIVLPISYTFSLVRADVGVLLSRTAFIWVAVVAVFFSIVIWKFGQQIFTKQTCYVTIGILFGFSMYLCSTTIADKDISINSYNAAFDETFAYVDEDIQTQFPQIGQGFIRADQKKQLLELDDRIKQFHLEDEYILNLNDYLQLTYYLLNMKACAVGNTMVAQSQEAEAEIIKIMEQKRPVVYAVDPIINYNIYYWMIEQGYIYNLQAKMYFPPEQVDHSLPGWTVSARDYPFAGSWINHYATSFGKSMDTLQNIFIEKIAIDSTAIGHVLLNGIEKVDDQQYTILTTEDPYLILTLKKPILGTDADFLYLSLDSSTDIKKSWDGGLEEYLKKNDKGSKILLNVMWASQEESFMAEKTIGFCYGDGRLLIPLGISPKWLTDHNIQIRLDIEDGMYVGDTFTIQEMKFLKLKQPSLD